MVMFSPGNDAEARFLSECGPRAELDGFSGTPVNIRKVNRDPGKGDSGVIPLDASKSVTEYIVPHLTAWDLLNHA